VCHFIDVFVSLRIVMAMAILIYLRIVSDLTCDILLQNGIFVNSMRVPRRSKLIQN